MPDRSNSLQIGPFQWICEHVNSCTEFILREGLTDLAQPIEQILSSSLPREEVCQEAHCGRRA